MSLNVAKELARVKSAMLRAVTFMAAAATVAYKAWMWIWDTLNAHLAKFPALFFSRLSAWWSKITHHSCAPKMEPTLRERISIYYQQPQQQQEHNQQCWRGKNGFILESACYVYHQTRCLSRNNCHRCYLVEHGVNDGAVETEISKRGSGERSLLAFYGGPLLRIGDRSSPLC